jgi:hypothetical protein
MTIVALLNSKLMLVVVPSMLSYTTCLNVTLYIINILLIHFLEYTANEQTMQYDYLHSCTLKLALDAFIISNELVWIERTVQVIEYKK